MSGAAAADTARRGGAFAPRAPAKHQFTRPDRRPTLTHPSPLEGEVGPHRRPPLSRREGRECGRGKAGGEGFPRRASATSQEDPRSPTQPESRYRPSSQSRGGPREGVGCPSGRRADSGGVQANANGGGTDFSLSPDEGRSGGAGPSALDVSRERGGPRERVGCPSGRRADSGGVQAVRRRKTRDDPVAQTTRYRGPSYDNMRWMVERNSDRSNPFDRTGTPSSSRV